MNKITLTAEKMVLCGNAGYLLRQYINGKEVLSQFIYDIKKYCEISKIEIDKIIFIKECEK